MILGEPPYDLAGTFSPSPERAVAWDALGHFGGEALPTFVRLAGSRDSKIARYIQGWKRKIPFLRARWPSAEEKHHIAVTAFLRYGSRGVPAIPELLPLLNDPQTAQPAVYALAFMKPKAAPQILALTNVLGESGSMLQIEGIAALGECGSNAAPAAPVLFQLLNSTNEPVSAMAAVALARIRAEAPRAAALIARRLSTASQTGFPAPPVEMYLWALGEIGPAAESVRSRINAFTNSSSRKIRDLAVSALRRIEPRSNQPVERNRGEPSSFGVSNE